MFKYELFCARNEKMYFIMKVEEMGTLGYCPVFAVLI